MRGGDILRLRLLHSGLPSSQFIINLAVPEYEVDSKYSCTHMPSVYQQSYHTT